jgi:hypothetical protein
MTDARRDAVRPFTPARENPQDLMRRTVGRERVLKRLIETFQSAAKTRNRPHTLLIGPRGSGKSHLLAIAVESLRTDAGLADRFAISRVPEDAIGFTRFTDVLDTILVDLTGSRVARGQSAAELTSAISEALGDRVLLLTIENLDRFMTGIGIKGQRDLRSWIETSGSVLMVATAPVIFSAVEDRDEPFFGAFNNVAVPDLTVDEGRELVELLARQRGDTATATFVASETGQTRIAALSQLTGGSPRIWMILADCLDPQSLDELIPAVGDLLENLVPYYQQLLWDLPPNEQRIVRALAEGEPAALSVTEIAEAADLGQAVTSTTLKRLTASRWVSSAKPAAPGDRRKTWYQLREPLLRHHFQYRSGDTRPLVLIVTLLRVLFDPEERIRHLLEAPPRSERLRHLAATFENHHTDRSRAEPLARREVEGLQILARLWISDEDRAALGAFIDQAIVGTRAGSTEGWSTRVETALQAAPMKELSEVENAVLQAVIATWQGTDPSGDPVSAFKVALANDGAREVKSEVEEMLDATAWAVWRTEKYERAAALYAILAEVRMELFGDTHDLTWIARSTRAWCIGMSGDRVEAVRVYDELLAEVRRTLRDDTDVILQIRKSQAMMTSLSGDGERARDLFRDLDVAYLRKYGAEDERRLQVAADLAQSHSRVGDHALATQMADDLLPLFRAAYGPDHPDTLDLRADSAQWKGEAGDASAARDDTETVLADATEALGPRDQFVLSMRRQHAEWVGKAGEPARGVDLLLDVVQIESLDDSLQKWCVATIAYLVSEWMNQRGTPPNDRPVNTLLGLIQAAWDGDSEALIQLPRELASVMEIPGKS